MPEGDWPAPGCFVAGPFVLPGAPCTPLASCEGCVTPALPPDVDGCVGAPAAPVAAPDVPVSLLGVRVDGPVRVSDGPWTPGEELTALPVDVSAANAVSVLAESSAAATIMLVDFMGVSLRLFLVWDLAPDHRLARMTAVLVAGSLGWNARSDAQVPEAWLTSERDVATDAQKLCVYRHKWLKYGLVKTSDILADHATL